MDDLVQRYLLLGLRLGKHIDGFVDAYYGPKELAEQVEAEPQTDAAELAAEAAAVTRELEAAAVEDEQRRSWLLGQIRGCETTARRLAGEAIGWADEVEGCHGVKPEVTPDERFAAAQQELERALPGDGELGDRYRAWLDTQVVPRQLILPAAERLEAVLRTRTERLYGLPSGEEAYVETVENEPWSGFNYYLGGLRSRVVVNVDLPVYSLMLPGLVAHEIYPGHHTEHAWKEVLLVRGRGYLEESILLAGTPQSVISEGIAMLADEMVLGDDADEVAATAFSGLGVPYDAETVPAARAFQEAVEGLGVNMAYALHVDGRPRDEVVEYGMRWGLRTRERVDKLIDFLTHPTWRAYASCYTAGLELCRGYVDGDRARYRRLLTEQLVPSDLAE